MNESKPEKWIGRNKGTGEKNRTNTERQKKKNQEREKKEN
jgi:hypothetical protein